jgi:hypothetical protein
MAEVEKIWVDPDLPSITNPAKILQFDQSKRRPKPGQPNPASKPNGRWPDGDGGGGGTAIRQAA